MSKYFLDLRIEIKGFHLREEKMVYNVLGKNLVNIM